MNIITKPLITTLAIMAAGMISPVIPTALAEEGAAPHAHHHITPKATRLTAEYVAPQVTLVRDDGKSVALADELNDERPLILTFIYTSCTTVCPVVSHTLAQLQRKLGAKRDRVHIMSITIDPEEDTPARLAAYAKKHNAGPEWRHYTGTLSASIATQRAFDAYRGDKMNHIPITLLRPSPGSPWIRIEGFATADELLAEIHNMLAANE